jgi:HPr kinase/phosphorylase
MWVFGETEMTYLSAIGEQEARSRLVTLFEFGVPAAFVTKGQQVPEFFLAAAREHSVPVLRSQQTTKEFYRRLKPYLEGALAPSTAVHGSLADVYGVGVLFTGQSGVGKSECVLDLVERGHRLVADDLVLVTRRATTCSSGAATSCRSTTWRSAASGSSTWRGCSGCAPSGNRSASR